MAMETPHPESNQVWQTKVDTSGRVLLPVEARTELGLQSGDQVVLVRDETGLHLKTVAQVRREIQDYFAGLWPQDVDVVAELLEERRQEAAREAGGD